MNTRKFKDAIAKKIMFSFCVFILSLAFLIGFILYQKAKPILGVQNLWQLLLSGKWHPTTGQFGMAGFILGTLWVTLIAVFIAVPVSILTSLYLSEYMPKRVKEFTKPVIDLLAGISPVIYGVWGVIAVVPFVRDYLMPFLSENLPFFPFVSDNYTGFCALSGGIVLAIMISPLMVSVMGEVLGAVSFEMRETSLALGATRWQTIKFVVLKKAWPGIIAAIILGISRAFGETIAVLMVAGCSIQEFPKSIFDTAYPLPALIANTYGEMMSIPLYDSSVLLAALILLVVTILFNIIGWGILFKSENE
ncbi:phosphate ABC transporter permease subunit PstC [Candidatus Desantisbacteria bacterium]|nr:phosphate ABC transporter permease subunit PstC [Candidatus Desantisbacteria bacterium]